MSGSNGRQQVSCATEAPAVGEQDDEIAMYEPVRVGLSTLERNGYGGYFCIELFNSDLWALPAGEAARRCYESLLPLCEG